MPYDNESVTYDYSSDCVEIKDLNSSVSDFNKYVEESRIAEAERSIAWGKMQLRLGDFYSAPQASQLLNLTMNRVVNLIKSGEMPGINVQGKWYVLKNKVDEEIR